MDVAHSVIATLRESEMERWAISFQTEMPSQPNNLFEETAVSAQIINIGDKIKMVAIGDLSCHPDNPRRGDVEAIRASISANGFYGALVVQRSSGYILAGNHRFMAAQAEGLNKVPVIYVDASDEDAKAILVGDNRLSDLAENDPALLAALLQAIQAREQGLTGTGYSDDDLAELLAAGINGNEGLAGEDEVLEPPANPVTKAGDLWLLGDHRLLCGDSTKREDVKRLMNGERAILFATDPPYLVDYDGTNHPGSKSKPVADSKNKDWSETYGVTWDDSRQGPELYQGFIKAAIAEAIEPNAAWYCWHASRRQAMVEAVWVEMGAFVHQQIIWSKDRPILTRSHYLWQHEPCLFGWIKGNKPPRVSEDYLGTIWQIASLEGEDRPDHPTPKPLDCFATPMRQHVKKGGLCYEPFSGSGSQIVAGESTGRRVFAMEISPAYVDVAVMRWQKATGKEATLDGDGRTFSEIKEGRVAA